MTVLTEDTPKPKKRNRYAALAFCWGDLLFELDMAGNIQFCAGPVMEFLGLPNDKVVGSHFLDLVAPSDAPTVTQFLKTVRSRGRDDGDVVHIRRSSNFLMAVHIAGYCMDEHFYVALRLRTGKPGPAEAVTASGNTATGLADQATFSRTASHRIKALENEGRQAEMTVLDIGGLAELQETLSEQETRTLLNSVGSFLAQNSLAGDTATRIGEQSFGLVHDQSLDMAVLQNQLLNTMRALAPANAALQVAHTTVAMDGARDVSEKDLAKGLMYALGNLQKQGSDGEVQLADLGSNISSLINQGISDMCTFRRILSERRFMVALQPIVHARNGSVHHFEALCRFDPASPQESPYRYITFAEETGLIHEFDLAMATKVVQWLRKMPVNNSRFSVAVNISGFSIGVPEYVRGLHALLKNNPWTADRLMFEITESSRMSDLEAANEFIQGLRKLNYKVCLDDFGAGAASFQYLSALEVDVVKIDGSAVRNAQKAAKGRAFLSALTEFCARLGVETIAEMIDSPESLRFVRDCRCHYVQGFLFGKPSRDVGDFSPLPNLDLFRQIDGR